MARGYGRVVWHRLRQAGQYGSAEREPGTQGRVLFLSLHSKSFRRMNNDHLFILRQQRVFCVCKNNVETVAAKSCVFVEW